MLDQPFMASRKALFFTFITVPILKHSTPFFWIHKFPLPWHVLLCQISFDGGKGPSPPHCHAAYKIEVHVFNVGVLSPFKVSISPVSNT